MPVPVPVVDLWMVVSGVTEARLLELDADPVLTFELGDAPRGDGGRREICGRFVDISATVGRRSHYHIHHFLTSTGSVILIYVRWYGSHIFLIPLQFSNSQTRIKILPQLQRTCQPMAVSTALRKPRENAIDHGFHVQSLHNH